MSSPYLVRPFRDTDTAAVISLWETVFATDPPWNKPADVIRTKLTIQGELFFVCLLEEKLVGTVLAGFDGVRGWIHKMACHPDAQRQGVATVLMHQAEQSLVQLGCPKLNIQVRADNKSALAFYQAAGYEIEDRVSLGKRLGPVGP